MDWTTALCGSDKEVWQSLEVLFWWLAFGIILEGQAQEINPSKRINGHLHRVQHDILILMCSQESQQFGLVLPGRYCSLWNMLQYVFCGTNLLSLDELQVNGEGDGNTEMLLFSDMCNDNDDSEVVIEANSDHSLSGYLATCSKSGKSEPYFSGSQAKQSKAKQIKFSAGLNKDQQWVILGEQVWYLSTCVAKQWVLVLSIIPPWDSR
jgi:hypothetical protein